jgi:hypothetical protein
LEGVKKRRWLSFYLPDPGIVLPIAVTILIVGLGTVWFGPFGGAPSREYTLTFKSKAESCFFPPQTVLQLDASRHRVTWARVPGEGIKPTNGAVEPGRKLAATIDYSDTAHVTLNGTLDYNYGSGTWTSDQYCSGTWTCVSNMRINKGWW